MPRPTLRTIVVTCCRPFVLPLAFAIFTHVLVAKPGHITPTYPVTIKPRCQPICSSLSQENSRYPLSRNTCNFCRIFGLTCRLSGYAGAQFAFEAVNFVERKFDSSRDVQCTASHAPANPSPAGLAAREGTRVRRHLIQHIALGSITSSRMMAILPACGMPWSRILQPTQPARRAVGGNGWPLLDDLHGEKVLRDDEQVRDAELATFVVQQEKIRIGVPAQSTDHRPICTVNHFGAEPRPLAFQFIFFLGTRSKRSHQRGCCWHNGRSRNFRSSDNIPGWKPSARSVPSHVAVRCCRPWRGLPRSSSPCPERRTTAVPQGNLSLMLRECYDQSVMAPDEVNCPVGDDGKHT